MSFENINKITSSLLDRIDDSEKLVLPLLAAKARAGVTKFPDDPTIMSMAGVLSRMSDNKMFITRAEFKTLYRGFYSRNSNFPEMFAAELGETVKLAGPTLSKRAEEGSTELDINDYVDPILASALRNAFDKNEPVREYSEKLAVQARDRVEAELKLMGMDVRASILGGNPAAILILADFKTAKGSTSVYVPVEVVAGKVLSPSCFLNNQGMTDFDRKSIVSYVQHNAGKKLITTANQMLGLLARVAQGNAEISNIELAVTKFNATKENSGEFFSNQITNQIVDQAVDNDLKLPVYHDKEIESFAERFDSAMGRAAFKFGERKVVSSRNALVAELHSFGHDSPQVSVQDCSDDTVTFAVALGKTAFTVPFRMSGSSILPNFLICNGSIKELSQESIELLMQKEVSDYKAAAAASPLYQTKPSDLINTIRTAMDERNFSKAEDSLNILAQSGDEKAYASGLEAYMGSLNKTASVEKEESTCDRIIRNAHSKFPICGHTGLPLHKVYQDTHGDCHPQYRKGMDDTYQGAYFMNSKIFG